MFKITLIPAEKKDGTYTLHNGYEYVKFTNKRKYLCSLRVHESFLNQCLHVKYMQMISALVKKDIDSMETNLNCIKRVIHFASYSSHLPSINRTLLPYRDEWNDRSSMFNSEIYESIISKDRK